MGSDATGRTYDVDEMIRQYGDWMRDNWNHPSVAIWDANNETRDAVFGDKIIPAVRALDLSNRNWENSYNPPAGPDDPVEDHPYLMYGEAMGGEAFRMTDLERRPGGPKEALLAARATILNEYGWLWVRRDGEPTVLTEKLYPKLLGPGSTKDERLELNAYLLGAKTEYWRAHRNYAGILHFVYLTCSYPGVFTADHFADVKALRLNPWFEDYMGEAMKPLGRLPQLLPADARGREKPDLPRDDGERPVRAGEGRAAADARGRRRAGGRARDERVRGRAARHSDPRPRAGDAARAGALPAEGHGGGRGRRHDPQPTEGHDREAVGSPSSSRGAASGAGAEGAAIPAPAPADRH